MAVDALYMRAASGAQERTALMIGGHGPYHLRDAPCTGMHCLRLWVVQESGDAHLILKGAPAGMHGRDSTCTVVDAVH
eukprot:CAMPEP_0206041746 /NCGR_PEP_ID=MMETSP1466-20131121/6148_1 /ASSEMBLY_ACC=CAM_ASM_001126 /TAXON_ID=44452 /ORGANISM="Pavlova gyrans, Strain CCMP608" /LENGTH=77 /DNA_ID=CAMNT_0053416449 /DNA_START=215 /DNA_END=446 /DNA_ORIENTATION=-